MNSVALINQKNVTIGDEELKVLKESLFKGFTSPEINYCLIVIRELNLNPLLRQVHFVKRGGTVVTQTGIDGFRLVAQRTGSYAGSDEPIFEYENNKKIPSKATVTVYKLLDGVRCAFTASARWDEYCPAPPADMMWKKMPHNMLAKCAEALALRKAFPAELSSIYEESEIQKQDDNKAKRLQEQVQESRQDAIEVESKVVVEPQSEEPEMDLACPLCGIKRILSSSKKSYYCPNWNDKKGEHPRLHI
jgi:phage recombination protein Bet